MGFPSLWLTEWVSLRGEAEPALLAPFSFTIQPNHQTGGRAVSGGTVSGGTVSAASTLLVGTVGLQRARGSRRGAHRMEDSNECKPLFEGRAAGGGLPHILTLVLEEARALPTFLPCSTVMETTVFCYAS